jgi:uncharacterized membrane protein
MSAGITLPRRLGTTLAVLITAAATIGATPSTTADPPLTGFTDGGRGFLREGNRFLPIRPPGSTGTLPNGINNHGQIIGTYDDRDRRTHGFILDRRGFTRFDHPKASGVLEGVAGTGLADNNDRGQLIGTYVAGDRARGFLLDHGRLTPIDAPGAVQTYPFSINDRGQMTVQAINADGTQPHYLLERGRFTRIAYPGAAFTVVHKINNSGRIVGVYGDGDPGIQHGFVYERGRYTTLDVPGTRFTGLNQSNARGQYVGYYVGEDGGSHGHVTRRGRVNGFDAPGAVTTSAYDINDRGQILVAAFSF